MTRFEPDLPFVLAITGASGPVYGLRLLQFLLESQQSVDLAISQAALQVLKEEMDIEITGDLKSGLLSYLNLPHSAPVTLHSLNDYGARIASGSYKTCGMAIVPCSGGTLGALAAGLTENIIQRAALVTLKEKRKLLILLREMPFGHIQLKNMLALSEAGTVVAAAAPGFYHRPQTIADQIDFVVGRVLDQFDFDNQLFKRWKDTAPYTIPTKMQPG